MRCIGLIISYLCIKDPGFFPGLILISIYHSETYTSRKTDGLFNAIRRDRTLASGRRHSLRVPDPQS